MTTTGATAPDKTARQTIRLSFRTLQAYETGEREQLCAYIEAVLDAAGIDVDEFAGRHRMTRHEITDEWRQW